MQIKKLIKNSAKTYQKLTPELKIPFALFLYILLFAQFIVSSFSKLRFPSKRLLPKLKKVRIHLPALKTKRTYVTKRIAYSFPLKSKVKYFILGCIFSLIFAFLPILMVIFLQDIPNPRELTLRQIPQTTKIYDRNKVLLYEIYTNQNRTLIALNDVPKHLQQATLAIEDKNFYKHPGFDIASIIRALKENLNEGKRIQGGSTITQQLVKSSLLNSEKKLSRKMKEVIISFWAERMYTKDQILEMYFNQVPYGGTAWGIEAASEVYFGKHVSELTLAESAFLAGITQAPSTYSPYSDDATIWKKRQREVLDRMTALKYITRQTAEQAAKQPLQFKEPRVPLRAPHFVMYVKDYLINQHGLAAVEKGGLTVVTSLDITKQEMAEKVVAEEVEKEAYLNLTNGATVITDPKNGDILAMVGSKDFNEEKNGKVNVAVRPRQPGSTVKAITYSAALLQPGYTAASLIDDSPITFPSSSGTPYTPVNYSGRTYGRVTMRFALANSLNISAVKTLNAIGIPKMVTLAKNMGIESWDKDSSEYGLAVTLGGAETTMLDMATVFGTLSNGGQRVDLNPILSVTDYKGNVLEEKTMTTKKRVLPEGIAYIISDILSDNQTRSAAFGPNSPLTIPGHSVSVKTGTTDRFKDNWTIGYTKDYVVTVWTGNNDGSSMSQNLTSGITGAAPIWHRLMVNLLGKTPTPKPPPPADIVMRQCAGRTEYFLKGTENNVRCGDRFPTPKVYSAQ